MKKTTNNTIYDEMVKMKIKQGEMKVELREIKFDIKSIKENHLPSLEKRIDNLEKTIWVAIGAISLAVFLIEIYVRLR